MVDMLARNWGWIAARGVAALVFGILTLVNPLISLAVLVLLFGILALVDGVFTALAAVANRREDPYWASLLVSGLLVYADTGRGRKAVDRARRRACTVLASTRAAISSNSAVVIPSRSAA